MSFKNYQIDLLTLMAVIGAEQHNECEFSNLVCKGIKEDSREIKEGDLFVARPGLESDGRRYISQAINKGALAVLVEDFQVEQFVQTNLTTVPVFKASNLADNLGLLAATFYQHPSKEVTVIGITGTNGKTTCAQMTAHVLESMGHKTGVMGTMGNGRYGDLVPTSNTTLDAISVHEHMANFRDQEMAYVVMEVSSHALDQGRVNEVAFDLAAFTNLSRDHLDYHGDMISYANAKKLLFKWPTLKHAVINADDAIGIEILNELDNEISRYSFSITAINAQEPDISVYTESVDFSDMGVRAELVTPWQEIALQTQLMGQFNLCNCLAVVTMLGALDFPLDDVIKGIASMKPVAGRMECFGVKHSPLVVVDYAHTPDALKHALNALKPHTQHRLWCIVGCGGDRDRGKRPQMASIAEEYADYVVLTADNPRSEDVMDIINEMKQGLSPVSDSIIEPDRKQAIETTITRAVIGDVVLVAGKGHEAYQHVGKERLPFSDVETVEQLLQRGKWS